MPHYRMEECQILFWLSLPIAGVMQAHLAE